MQRGDKLVSFFLGRNNPTFCHPKKKPQLECQGRCQDALEVHPRRDKTMYLEAGCGIVGRLRRIGVALGSSPGSSRVCSVVFAPLKRVFYLACCPQEEIGLPTVPR